MQNFNLKQSVLATLCFFDIFHHPLKLKEIEEDLLFCDPEQRNMLDLMKKIPQIGCYDESYFLFGRKNLVARRYHRDKLMKKMWRRIFRHHHLFSLVPFIKSVSVCNNLAFKTFDKKSDIDLFVITKSGRLFTSRLILTLLLSICGIRRHGKKIARRFCLSFFVTENAMDIGKIRIHQNDIYLAFWSKKLLPILNRDQTINRFYRENRYWLKKFFPSKLTPEFKKLSKPPVYAKWLREIMESLLKGKIGDRIEERLQKWQISRALEKKQNLQDKSGTIISKDILKFHDRDQRKEIYLNWHSKMLGLKAFDELRTHQNLSSLEKPVLQGNTGAQVFQKSERI